MLLVDSAAALAGLGMHLFPVGGDDGKKPLVTWRDRSTTEPAPLFAEHPAASGIGLDCGKSGLVVLDVDDVDSFAEWVVSRTIDVGATLTAQTPRGGRHLYYQADPDRPIRNSASRLAPGLDVRGDGGYVVAPPSPGYVWTTNVPPAPAPEWLHEAIAELSARPEPREMHTGAGPVGAVLPGEQGHADRWGQRILDAELAKLASAPAGRRNVTLFESACNVFEAAKGGHIDDGHARSELMMIADRIGLASDEIFKSIDSAWDRTQPRHPKEELRPPSPVSGATIERPAPPPAATGRLTVLSLSDIDELPPARWLLNRRLPEGMTVLYGRPGAGKTFAALDWTMTLAAYTGETVLYFAGEGVSGFKDRIRAWRRMNVALDPSSFAMIPQAPQFLDASSVAEFDAVVADQKPALVVIDTLHRSMGGADENSASDVGLVIRVLDGWRQEHGTSSLILHHTSVDGSRERGSTSLRGAADAMWKATGSTEGGMTLSCDKLKDGEFPGESYHRFRASGDSVVLHPLTSSLIGADENRPL